MLRNLITTLRRFTLASTLNIVGLAVAFATFSIIMMQVTFEMGYGKDDPNYKEIFRLEGAGSFTKDKWTGQISAPVIKHLENDEPKVKSIYYCDDSGEIEVSGSDTTNSWSKVYAYWNYVKPTNVFEFTMVDGSVDQLPLPGNVIIPESLAKILYPNGNAVGQILYCRGRWHREGDQTIVGVYKDFAVNSMLQNRIFGGMPQRRSKVESGVLFDAGRVFVRCSPSDTTHIMQGIRNYCANAKDPWGSDYNPMRLTAVEEAYFRDDFIVWNETQPGNRTTTALLLGISILIIVIAAINFINFSTALAPIRIVGLNTRHVFGKTKAELRAMLIFEATAIAAIAYGVAMVLIYCFERTPYASLMRTNSVALEDNATLMYIMGAGALVIGFLAGLYPAIYCTRFDAATVLKGNGMGSRSGQWMRLTLIGFQYVISIGLIIGSLFIAEQNRYLSSFPLGFNKENVFIIRAQDYSHNEKSRLANTIMENPDFTDYTLSWGILGENQGAMSRMPIGGGDTLEIQNMFVLHDFLDFFKIPVIAGRNFVESDYIFQAPDKRGFYFDAKPSVKKAIFNRKAQQMYNIKLDSIYGLYQCIGISDNVNNSSLYYDYQPSLFVVGEILGNIYLRYTGDDMAKGYNFIHTKFKEILGPEEYFQCEILENKLNEAYVKEQNLSKIITLLSIVAIILSLVGVFGLVVFENQYRRKEIGIRKVFGSRIGQILMLFNRKFIIICAIAFAISLPITYYFINEWLGGFAFRTAMHWWIFAAGLAIVLLLTILTVTIQSYRSATENPTKSIKN